MYGLFNASLNSVTAENNYWGDATGPYHPILNPSGLGDRVSDNVDFIPWLISPGGGQTFGELTGTVLSSEYRTPLSNVQVIIASATYNAITTTDANGHYQFINVPAGTYTAMFGKNGYLSEEIQNVVVTGGGHTTQNFTLKKTVQHGDVLVEIDGITQPYIFTTDLVPGATNYTFHFTSDNWYAKADPSITPFQITVPGPELILTDTDWQQMTPCRYDWYVVTDNGNTSPTRSFLKIKMYPATTYAPSITNVLLLHGWISDHTIWQDVEAQFDNVLQYATWNVDYPNTGHIPELASIIPKCIEYIKAKSRSNNKINIIAHSMGGLLARAYINGIATNVAGDLISFQSDIDKVVLLGTPNTGGKFSSLIDAGVLILDELIGAIGGMDQYAVYEMEPNSTFIGFLNQHPTPSSVNIIAFAGYDSNLIRFLIKLGLDIDVPAVIIGIDKFLNMREQNDVVVTLKSATMNFTIPYKLLSKHHLNIYETNSLSDPLMSNILQFFDTGQITSDDINNWSWWRFFGNSLKNVFFLAKENNRVPVSGGYIEVENLTDHRRYLAPVEADGSFHLENLSPADYQIATRIEGFQNDSVVVFQADSLSQIHQNFILNEDTLYPGPKNFSISINNGAPSTVDTIVTLALHAENASEMMISPRIDFPDSIWLPYDSAAVFTIHPMSGGIATVFARFRSPTGEESSVVMDDILYSDSIAANLQVNSTLPAEIILNGSSTQQMTPYTFTNLGAGEYSVSVFKSGYASDPDNYVVTLTPHQSVALDFQMVDVPPPPPVHFSGITHQDTILLTWRNASVEDLQSVILVYRLDGVFPTTPNDGTVVYDSVATPNAQDHFRLLEAQGDTIYFFAAFSRDMSGNYSSGAQLSVVVPHINQAPQIVNLRDTTFYEDSSLMLSLNNFVIDDDPVELLNWQISSSDDSLFVSYDSLNKTIIFSAASNYFADSITVVFVVTDPYLATDSTTIFVSVLSVNDPPVVSEIPPIVFPEDSSYSFDLDPYVTDVDHDTSEISWSASFPGGVLAGLRKQIGGREGMSRPSGNALAAATLGEVLVEGKEPSGNPLPSLRVVRRRSVVSHPSSVIGLLYGESDSLMIVIDSLTHVATVTATANFWGLDIPVIFTAVD
ncbi:MAG: hypothetical protein D6732_21425, partial [Methanobacteriota archaeon]